MQIQTAIERPLAGKVYRLTGPSEGLKRGFLEIGGNSVEYFLKEAGDLKFFTVYDISYGNESIDFHDYKDRVIGELTRLHILDGKSEWAVYFRANKFG